MAQLVEHQLVKLKVVGSNPIWGVALFVSERDTSRITHHADAMQRLGMAAGMFPALPRKMSLLDSHGSS